MAHPQGILAQKIRAGCDAIPQRKRLGLVAVLFDTLLLTAFLLFGNACYRMGQGKGRQKTQIEHIQQFEIPTKKANMELPDQTSNDLPENN